MSEDRATIAWQHWRQSVDKLDYFLLGTASALTAYIGQHLAPQPRGLNPASLELAALVALAGSVAAAVDRLRSNVAALGGQSIKHGELDRAAQLRTALLTGSGPALIDSARGVALTPAEVAQQAVQLEGRGQEAARLTKQWERRSARSYVIRDTLLVLGVALYVSSKIWAAIAAR